MNNQYKKAVEKFKSFNISSIRREDQLLGYNIGELKALCAKFNREMGICITKAKFGKTYAQMRKVELIAALWYVRKIVMCSPKGSYTFQPLSQRIACQMCDGVQHVVYMAFDEEYKANQFYNFLNETKEFSSLAAIRPADKMKGYKFEIKIWDIKPDLLTKLIARDRARVEQEKQALIVKAEQQKKASEVKSNQMKYAEEQVKEIAREMSLNDMFELQSAQRMYDNMSQTDAGKEVIIKFLDARGFQVLNGVVELA